MNQNNKNNPFKLLTSFCFIALSFGSICTAQASIKNNLQDEAARLVPLTQSNLIQQALASNININSNSNTPETMNTQNQNTLINNSLGKYLQDFQKNQPAKPPLKIVGLMVTDENGHSLGQTIETKNRGTTYRFATNYIEHNSKDQNKPEPKITQRIKISFSEKPVSRIIVPVLNQNKLIGTLTEWLRT